MERENPPPYSSEPPPPGFAPPHQSEPLLQPMKPPPPGFAPPHQSQPLLQPMKPPYPYPQQEAHQEATQVIIVQGPAVQFGPKSQRLICPSCHAEISTSVRTKPNTKTLLFALLLCMFGGVCCVCIPYCIDSCQTQNHYCPCCRAFLGYYQN